MIASYKQLECCFSAPNATWCCVLANWWEWPLIFPKGCRFNLCSNHVQSKHAYSAYFSSGDFWASMDERSLKCSRDARNLNTIPWKQDKHHLVIIWSSHQLQNSHQRDLEWESTSAWLSVKRLSDLLLLLWLTIFCPNQSRHHFLWHFCSFKHWYIKQTVTSGQMFLSGWYKATGYDYLCS